MFALARLRALCVRPLGCASSKLPRKKEIGWPALGSSTLQADGAGAAGGRLARPARAADDVILDATRYPVLAGRYSVFAEFQSKPAARPRRLRQDRARAWLPRVSEPSGRIGPETRQGIQAALGLHAAAGRGAARFARQGRRPDRAGLACSDGREPAALAAGSHDRDGAFLRGHRLRRPPEWNMCQDNKGRNRTSPTPGRRASSATTPATPARCSPGARAAPPPARAARSSGSCGWRGSRTGLWSRRRSAPSSPTCGASCACKAARATGICMEVTPLRRFMCAVWMEPARRRVWEKRLGELGHSPLVRRGLRPALCAARVRRRQAARLLRAVAASGSHAQRGRLRLLPGPHHAPGRTAERAASFAEAHPVHRRRDARRIAQCRRAALHLAHAAA